MTNSEWAALAMALSTIMMAVGAIWSWHKKHHDEAIANLFDSQIELECLISESVGELQAQIDQLKSEMSHLRKKVKP